MDSRAFVFVALLAGCSQDPRTEPDAARPLDERALVGRWVWHRTIEDGVQRRVITASDMAIRVGASGWEGCTDPYLCTRFGIDLVSFGAARQFWSVRNVVTSSDYQRIGSYELRGDVLHVHQRRLYSCAHPDVNDATPSEVFFRARRVDGELWLSSATDALAGLAPFSTPPPARPPHWIAFRRVNERDFLDGLLLRLCQDRGVAPFCFEGCTSRTWGD